MHMFRAVPGFRPYSTGVAWPYQYGLDPATAQAATGLVNATAT